MKAEVAMRAARMFALNVLEVADLSVGLPEC
jgi:hypothetical protein